MANLELSSEVTQPVNTEVLLKKGFVLDRINCLYTTWVLEFEVKPFAITAGLGGIIRVTIGGDRSRYGDRTPAIWYNSHKGALQFSNAVNGNMDR